jgi:two-component sensor histidine kinase
MHPDDLPGVMATVHNALNCPDRTVTTFEYRIVHPSGEVRHVTSRGEILKTSSGKARIIGVLMDVTVDRLREAELAKAVAAQGELLKQKELLLAEVNHRVKNSLQLVVSTLRLQARRIEDKAVGKEFERAISRVRAIVSVHERLYRDQNSLTVEISGHLKKLCLDILGDAPSSLVVVEVDQIELPTERAIPISVIVNELLASALTPANRGPIRVSLTQRRDGQLELAVEASGDHSSQLSLPSDLGAKLVRTIASQIEGSFHEERTAQGNRAVLVFPVEASS